MHRLFHDVLSFAVRLIEGSDRNAAQRNWQCRRRYSGIGVLSAGDNAHIESTVRARLAGPVPASGAIAAAAQAGADSEGG
ncbi:hypothetical protein P3W85_32710 [Cupriavidus basilensis]|uniref:Uncharacterized protein n=1 Tax=Cupriavidus basilensis TaxID=68895 RepID=A0ABT6AYG3_9BURK|nr:hypothetical protein [Cupriavidus basilensis]MDF3837668.1 hypothetical protein [Cupriavidus basilensis]